MRYSTVEQQSQFTRAKIKEGCSSAQTVVQHESTLTAFLAGNVPAHVLRCMDMSTPYEAAARHVDEACCSTEGVSTGGNADREGLYAELAPLVRRLIRQYGQTPEMCQDLAGEIYCRFCAILEAYDPQRGVPLRPYLIRQLSATTYTYARQQWRTQKREVTWEAEFPIGELSHAQDPTTDWIQALSEQQLIASLPHAMAHLPLRQRQVVVWRYYEERSFEEIAQSLGVQTATARSLLRHGLNRLRQRLVSAVPSV